MITVATKELAAAVAAALHYRSTVGITYTRRELLVVEPLAPRGGWSVSGAAASPDEQGGGRACGMCLVETLRRNFSDAETVGIEVDGERVYIRAQDKKFRVASGDPDEPTGHCGQWIEPA